MNEVSCRVVINGRENLLSAGLDWASVLSSNRYSAEHLFNPRNRIDWSEYALFCERAKDAAGSLAAYQELCLKWGAGPNMLPLRRLIRLSFNAVSFYRLFGDFIFAQEFGGILRQKIEAESPESFLCRIALADGHTPCRAFFESGRGVLAGIPSLIGHPFANVQDLEISPTHGLYCVYPPPFDSLKNRITAFFSIPLRARDASRLIRERLDLVHAQAGERMAALHEYQKIVEENSDGIVIVSDGIVQYANPAFHRILRISRGVTATGLPSKTWMEQEVIERLREWAREPRTFADRMEVQAKTDDGERLWVEVSPPRQTLWKGSPAVLWTLRERSFARQVELASAEAAEKEQRRIADDLHDGLGQEMTAIALQLKVLEGRLEKGGFQDAAQLSRLGQLTSQAARHARDIAHGLSPRIVVERGLLEALRWLASHTGDLFGMQVTVASSVTAVQLEAFPVEHSLAVYRGVQEIISNARKHGKADMLEISLALLADSMKIVIRDNGKGLADTEAHASGMGLKILQHRMTKVGGTFQIGNRADGANGVEVTLLLPIHPECPRGGAIGSYEGEKA
jgi:two-component system, LuxR family, sensor kinase FixL